MKKQNTPFIHMVTNTDVVFHDGKEMHVTPIQENQDGELFFTHQGKAYYLPKEFQPVRTY